MTKLETLTFFSASVVINNVRCRKFIIIRCCHHSRSSKRNNSVAPGSRCHSNGGLFTRQSEFESRFRNRVVKQSRPVKYGISVRDRNRVSPSRHESDVLRIAMMDRTREIKLNDSANPADERPENECGIVQFADDNEPSGDKVLTQKGHPEEILRQVQRELCLIKLCWPDVPITKDLYAQSLPDTYRRVSDKERLLLWYAENFRRQIYAKDANRRPLLLACENECGVQVGVYMKFHFRRNCINL